LYAMDKMYLTVDGQRFGTGVRSSLGEGHVELVDLNISPNLMKEISLWLARYQDEVDKHPIDAVKAERLDLDGIGLCKKLSSELSPAKVEYYSDFKGTKLWFSEAGQ
jgi:hypothetical protein